LGGVVTWRWSKRATVIAAIGLVVILACCCAGVSSLWFHDNAQRTSLASCQTGTTVAPTDLPDIDPYTKAQVSNAATIVSVGQSMKVPPRGWVIAVATAMQESHLANLGNLGADNDHDSLGLFQQRPSQGWGTPAQIMDPTYAAGKFYSKLLTVPNWVNLPLTDAAQDVQRSAYPDAYAKWEPDATQLIGALVTTNDPSGAANVILTSQCSLDSGDVQLDPGGAQLPAGFALPAGTPNSIVKAVNFALAQLGTAYAFGGNCTDAKSGRPALRCDCSSLTMMAYRSGGLRIPRLARQQSRAGTPIYDLNALLPGDLLFLVGSDGTRANPGHVGMYLGDGILIQAPHTGAVVHLTKLSSWKNIIVGVRRIVAQPHVGSQNT
jgi:cell wall-associated NlpC family hydrolase